jgi:hypothetical protein
LLTDRDAPINEVPRTIIELASSSEPTRILALTCEPAVTEIDCVEEMVMGAMLGAFGGVGGDPANAGLLRMAITAPPIKN